VSVRRSGELAIVVLQGFIPSLAKQIDHDGWNMTSLILSQLKVADIFEKCCLLDHATELAYSSDYGPLISNEQSFKPDLLQPL